VHGVGGDALGGVNGGGVAEAGGSADIVGGQPDGEVMVAVMCGGEPAVVAHCGDGPAVAVLNPVSRTESEPAVVGPGDDHIPDTRLITVRQPHHRMRHLPVEAMIAGATVQPGHQIAGGGEHDGIQSG